MAEVEPSGTRTSLVLVDTSALFALHRAADEFHGRAWAEYERLLDHGLSFWTTSYVLVETVALMDRRLGFASVLDFEGWREAHIEVCGSMQVPTRKLGANIQRIKGEA